MGVIVRDVGRGRGRYVGGWEGTLPLSHYLTNEFHEIPFHKAFLIILKDVQLFETHSDVLSFVFSFELIAFSFYAL